jgi:hypothetical protein
MMTAECVLAAAWLLISVPQWRLRFFANVSCSSILHGTEMAIITDCGAQHVQKVPVPNPDTVTIKNTGHSETCCSLSSEEWTAQGWLCRGRTLFVCNTYKNDYGEVKRPIVVYKLGFYVIFQYSSVEVGVMVVVSSEMRQSELKGSKC